MELWLLLIIVYLLIIWRNLIVIQKRKQAAKDTEPQAHASHRGSSRLLIKIPIHSPKTWTATEHPSPPYKTHHQAYDLELNKSEEVRHTEMEGQLTCRPGRYEKWKIIVGSLLVTNVATANKNENMYNFWASNSASRFVPYFSNSFAYGLQWQMLPCNSLQTLTHTRIFYVNWHNG